ncbi:DUF4102 domain-containing protein [Paracoccus sp. MKU1]|uniref:DUF4102 domain-containing protein n=1 Tax=Paracoccus sp. MKU1 TaxID=1745182 RepID=UPI00128EF48C|nr:DUF4102 domain-containing protein [Paracoccus sp. MKU1]
MRILSSAGGRVRIGLGDFPDLSRKAAREPAVLLRLQAARGWLPEQVRWMQIASECADPAGRDAACAHRKAHEQGFRFPVGGRVMLPF